LAFAISLPPTSSLSHACQRRKITPGLYICRNGHLKRKIQGSRGGGEGRSDSDKRMKLLINSAFTTNTSGKCQRPDSLIPANHTCCIPSFVPGCCVTLLSAYQYNLHLLSVGAGMLGLSCKLQGLSLPHLDMKGAAFYKQDVRQVHARCQAFIRKVLALHVQDARPSYARCYAFTRY
jgi:hypothetical protein